MSNIGIIVGSVYGNAQNAAEEAQAFLTNQGHDVELHVDPDVSLFDEQNEKKFFFELFNLRLINFYRRRLRKSSL